jgi:hypothetical protein
MPRCLVTAIAPGGRRSKLEVEATSAIRAVLAYNVHCRGNAKGLVIPDRNTKFEVTPEGGETIMVTWAEANGWANREAQRRSARRLIVPDKSTNCDRLESRDFPEAANPRLLTGISDPCRDSKHEDCPGHGEYKGETVLCNCVCHRRGADAQS